MNTNGIDRTGHRRGRLLFLELVGRRHGILLWRCVCDCGKETLVADPKTQSCGCLTKERSRAARIRKTRSVTQCPHVNRKHKAYGKCRQCYQIDLRAGKDSDERNLYFLDKKNKLGAKAVATASTIQRWRSRFNLTPERYERMFLECGGRCICGEAFAPGRNTCPHLDHDHKCCPTIRSCGRCLRGLLCPRCNRVLGSLKEDPRLLPVYMVEYLKRYEAHRALMG